MVIMTRTIMQTTQTLTLSSLKGKGKTSIGTIPKKRTQNPVMYKGIEKKVMFSVNQERT